MECSEPGAIRKEELLAYLAGEKVRPFVGQHVATCQHCAEELAAYQRIERTLTGKLYRWDCPPSQVLGEYQLGLLSKELTAAVKNHLGMCVLCAAEVATLTEFLRNDPMLEERVTVPNVAVQTSAPNHNHRSIQDAKHLVDRFLEQSSAGFRRIVATLQPPQPRLAFQRDLAPAAIWPRSYSAEDVSISIQLERGTNQRNSVQLIGFVTRKGNAVNALQGTQVLLSPLQSEEKISSAPGVQYTQTIDELGNFVFASIAPATYSLELQFPGSIIAIDSLPVTLQDL